MKPCLVFKRCVSVCVCVCVCVCLVFLTPRHHWLKSGRIWKANSITAFTRTDSTDRLCWFEQNVFTYRQEKTELERNCSTNGHDKLLPRTIRLPLRRPEILRLAAFHHVAKSGPLFSVIIPPPFVRDLGVSNTTYLTFSRLFSRRTLTTKCYDGEIA